MEIHGFCDDQFLPLKEAFLANFEGGLELGASLAVTHRGKMVVDLWGGYADPEETRPWQENTIVSVTSTTKIMVTIAALMLIDRGLLELDAPIVRYWPEFAAGGKAAVTVRDALTHQAGVPGFVPPVPFEAVRDWLGIAARLAAEPHWFDGRKVVCYHNLTYGFLVGELIRRVDGRQPSQFFREEIAQKVGADFQIGLTSTNDVFRLAVPRGPAGPEDVHVLKGVGVPGQVIASIGPRDRSSWESLSVDAPSVNGFGNARSIARVCAIIAQNGELDGRRYLSKQMVEQAGTEQVYGQCPLLGWTRWGLGLGMHSKEFPAPSSTCLHWGGWGGSWGVMDPKAGVSLGYAPNHFIVNAVDPRHKGLGLALRKLLPAL